MAKPSATWSDLFALHFGTLGIEQKEAAQQLRVTPSTVYYWLHGSRPRDPKTLARVDRWSKGAVPASAARVVHPSHGDAA